MTPREEILKQFVESADHIVGPCQTGIVQSGQPRSPYHPLQICSWPTLRSWAVRAAENKRDLTMVLLPADLIIVDEAHLSVTQQMYSFVLMHYLQTAAKMVGVTATPSGKNLGMVYTSIKHVTSVRTLIKDGHTQQVPSFTN